jgi:uncharacterized protein
MRPLSNVIGIDDAPFQRSQRGRVGLVGAVLTKNRLDGVLLGHVRRDGADATRRIAGMVKDSAFFQHLQGVILQGIAVAGFNVIDIHALNALLDRPVLVVARRAPDLAAIRRALIERVPGGARKWQLIERAGPMEPIAKVLVQRAGLDRARAERYVRESSVHGVLPEALRIAHLIAGGLATGHSRGGA